MGLRVWEKSDNSDAVIFAEDDTVFVSNFGKELHRSLKQLPATWQARGGEGGGRSLQGGSFGFRASGLE